jgi:hypothetical protein
MKQVPGATEQYKFFEIDTQSFSRIAKIVVE